MQHQINEKMNKKYFYKIFVLLVAILFLINNLFAQSFVNESFAKKIGENFISNKMGKEAVSLNLFHTENGVDGQPNLYIFNVDGGGFVMVSASRNFKPVLAYSLKHCYDGEIPEPAWYFINNYSRNIDFCDERGIMMNDEVVKEWKLLENNELPYAKYDRTVDPLIQTLWNQDYPYNYYAPQCNNYWTGNHCYAGCVACAMSQIMKYWDHPVHGHGSHSYYHSTYGTQSADFGATTYNWSIMPISLGSQADDAAKAVALLMYHCGVSVDMNFSPDGSGAFSKDVETAFRQYFGYCAATYKERSQYTEDEWVTILRSELDKSQPLYFSGTSDSGGGHAIVCDGYDNNGYFSFNLGWSGSGNAFYSINDVAGYHNNEAIVMNIKPLEINADDNGIIYVASDGTGDGSSWANATPYLEYATAMATDVSKMIWVKTGTYYGDLNSDNGAFSIYKNNRVYGGFAGNEAPNFNLDDRDFEANPTILDGQTMRRVLYQTNHFMNAEYSIWDGFTIQHGFCGAGAGAYLCCNSRFANCTFYNNTANGFGGGAYIISAYYENATVKFTNCTFDFNIGALGGAICDMTGAHILNCTFKENRADTKGGAYYVYQNKESKIVNCIFYGNAAQCGGAMYNKGKITVINCDIVRNIADDAGPGIFNESSYSRFYNSVIWGNVSISSPYQISGTSKFDHCAIQGGFSGGTNIINLSNANDGTDNGNYPRFADVDARDFSIANNSILVDAGDNSVTGVTGPDILGNQRIVNNIIDLGAIENQYYDMTGETDTEMFDIYPNPIDNQMVIVKNGDISVEVYNALGQKMVSAEANDKIIINTSEWEKGVYLVKVNDKTIKILK